MVSGFSSSNHPQPPRPKPFDMTEPYLERGIWCFWLTAEAEVLQFVQHLHCVASVSSPGSLFRPPQGRVLVTLNPRYDVQEVWLWLYDLLEAETREVELGEWWEDAITTACHVDEDNF